MTPNGEKKTRFANCEILPKNLDSEAKMAAYLTGDKEGCTLCGVRLWKAYIKAEFGVGRISCKTFPDFSVVIARCKFMKDVICYPKQNGKGIRLSFLLKGQKIFSEPTWHEDFYQEGHDCYMTCFQNFEGCVRIAGNKNYKEIVVLLSRSFLEDNEFLKDEAFTVFRDKVRMVPITPSIQATLKVLESHQIKGPADRLFLKAKVLELLAEQFNNYTRFRSLPETPRVGESLKKVYAVKQHLENNLHKNFSVQELCKIFGLNGQSLKADFKRIFGASVTVYVQAKKMEKAQMLLDNTELMVYEVAEEVGYKNATHFSAAFKRHFGKTPKQYKNVV
ncbi:helix-turn-helix domain-containing protein [Zobellia galactanivorans]|uniref:helix-turn-helix domain-containing protein n=1 Tax=Zobellia galactanivorans (strain DSM 12802 / CCUG 47099 / CIP 106680 / NCIMB 13871 / Dsij) TaxID=63186 RepID=UPI001C07D81A|nr:AraC family transcriptional regulator [Zobellia galactanivorans]MBU3027890.1 AraC family transcriptional regulator [Zobellia galactanivorans]